MQGNFYLDNSSVIKIGADSTGQSIVHNGSNAYFKNKTGSMIFENSGATDQLTIQQSGGLLQFDGATKLE